jgi:hypothetical protein
MKAAAQLATAPSCLHLVLGVPWELSVTLCRYNARMERTLVGYFALAVGRAYMPGICLHQPPPAEVGTPGFAAAAQDASKHRAYRQVSPTLLLMPMSVKSFELLGAPALPQTRG